MNSPPGMCPARFSGLGGRNRLQPVCGCQAVNSFMAGFGGDPSGLCAAAGQETGREHAYARVPSTRAANEFAACCVPSPWKRAGRSQPASAGLRMPGREFIHGLVVRVRAYARVPSARAARWAANEFAAWYVSSLLKRAGWLKPASAGLQIPGREFIHGRLWRRSVWALRCSWSGDRLRTCVRTRTVHAGARWAAGRSQPAAAGLRMPGREFIHGRPCATAGRETGREHVTRSSLSVS